MDERSMGCDCIEDREGSVAALGPGVQVVVSWREVPAFILLMS